MATTVILLAILLLGSAFRFYNVNWDKGTYHIHPDERHTTMVITAIRWPSSLGRYFDTSRSPLNPHNANTVYFYGTFPLFLTKFVATQLEPLATRYSATHADPNDPSSIPPPLTSYDQIHLVGRVLSGLFDLGTVLLTFFLGRRLLGRRVGLLAAFLLALAVLNIQGSHYFVVDTFLTFFVALTLWFTLDVAEGKGWPAFLALGLSMGLTLACKVSVFLLAAIVALGAWMAVRRAMAKGRSSGRAWRQAILGLATAALLAVAVFRVAQPYAWAGPNYNGWDSIPEPWNERLRFFERIPEPIRAVLMPDPQWVADLVSAGAQQTGEADMPWGRQWTERTRWIYPLENMVLWGMGVPLAAAAWLGVGLVLIQMMRAWRRRRVGQAGAEVSALGQADSLILLPLAWVLLIFVWQGGQWVKSIRYFLPIYPQLSLFAAYLVVRVWDWAKGRRAGVRVGARALGLFVPVGTLLWALAFIQIYREPVTRVQATKWIYDNIAPGAAITHEHFDDPLPFNMFGRIAYDSAGLYHGIELTLYDEDTPEKLEKLLDDLDQADYLTMSSGRLFTSIPRIPMRYPVTTRYYELLFAGRLGFEKVAEFHSYPRLFGIEFNDDRAEEQFTVYDHPKALIYRKTAGYDRESVKAMLSNGVDWGSVAHWLNPRDVPKWKRERARELRLLNDPQQGDTDRGKGLMLSEEQRRVQEEGGTWASLFDRKGWVNRWPTLPWLLVLGAVGLAALPLTVGVFGRLPDRGYVLARPVGVLLLAWLSWILTNLTPLHYSRGTILLALGLVAGASAASLALPSQRARLRSLWLKQWRLILVNEALFLAFFALMWLIRWGNSDLWHAWKGGEKPMDLAYLNAVIKSTEFPPYDPWFAGGYLNYYYFGQVMVGTLIKLVGIVPAVAYNLVIPTWCAMTATGAFCVTYNLVARRTGEALAAEDGVAASEALGSGQAGKPASRLLLRPVCFGLLGALFVAVLGNLGQVHLILLKLAEGVMGTFKSTIPGLVSLVRVVVGSFEVAFGGRALPIGVDEWYWNASRVIPSGPYESVITEFPFFTHLYGDLHAHLIAMPLTFVSLALAVAVIGGGGKDGGTGPAKCGWKGWVRWLPLLLLWGLVIGALRTTNTWDVPPQLLVALGALAIGQFWGERQAGWRAAWAAAWRFALVFVLGWSLLYRPFWVSYGSYYNSVAVWSGTRTPLWAYLVAHGLFLFAMLSHLFAGALGKQGTLGRWPLLRRLRLTIQYRKRLEHLRAVARLVGVRGLPVGKWVWAAAGLFVLVELFCLVPGLAAFTRANTEAAEAGAYSYRGLAVVAFGLPVALIGLVHLFGRGRRYGGGNKDLFYGGVSESPARGGTAERLWTYWVLLGLAMTLGVELIVLQGDIGRMNTVFKFYIQTWLIWGVAAAVGLAWLAPRVGRWRRSRGWWLGALAVLLAAAALYPPLASVAKVNDRFAREIGPGLDGWAYMEVARYQDPNGAEYDLKWDRGAIGWLLDNVVGSPTILEGHAPEYRWGARYSINTGLPAVVGWNWHQRQQRAVAGDRVVWDRVEDVARMYNSRQGEMVLPLLRKYGVRYVIVGPLERTYYAAEGLAKFEVMAREGVLRAVYRNEGVTIYEVQ